MLSRENPPSDPSEISKVNSTFDSKSASDDNQRQIDADLLQAGLVNEDPLHKFSIRDHVFHSRDKNLENHWPFSKLSFQLCLKYGVKDVLPPYENPSCLINQTVVENVDGRHGNFSLEPSKLINSQSFPNVLSVSEEDKQYHPLNTVNQSAVVAKNCSFAASGAVNSAEFLPEKPYRAVSASTDIVDNSAVKKCRSPVKVSSTADPKPREELLGNTSVISEAMASKVCPVCKTFSSSSNTTLNAHIDQCLSVEPANQRTSNLKGVQHKIKPRKVRLMVDVYTTAPRCTLDDLEKRNATNRAASSSYRDVDSDTEEKNAILSPVNVEDNTSAECLGEISNRLSYVYHMDGNEGAVYFDSSGTKLRILSKLNDLQAKSSLDDCCNSGKLVKRDIRGRRSLNKKNNPRHKLLRCRLLDNSSMPKYSLKASGTDEKESNFEEEDVEAVPPHAKACDRTKSDGAGKANRKAMKRKSLEKRNQLEEKIAKNRSTSLDCSSSKTASESTFWTSSDDDSAAATMSPESSSRDECIFGSHEKYVELRKRTKNGSWDSLCGSENQAFSKRSLSSCMKQSAGRALSVREAFVSWTKKLKRGMDTKRPRRCYSPRSEEEATVVLNPFSRHWSFQSTAQKEKSVDRAQISSREPEEASKPSDISQQTENRGVDRNPLRFSSPDTSVGTCAMDAAKNADLCTPPSNIYVEESTAVFHEFNESQFSGLGNLIGSQLVISSAHVDPISIPGPPGSFLPSPGRVFYEEPQGNLANTTESSYSPVSGTSLVSNVPYVLPSPGVSFDEMQQGVSRACAEDLGSCLIPTRTLKDTRQSNLEPRKHGVGALAELPSCSSDAKFSPYGNYYSSGSSNPTSGFLRLMGKNLTVLQPVIDTTNCIPSLRPASRTPAVVDDTGNCTSSPYGISALFQPSSKAAAPIRLADPDLSPVPGRFSEPGYGYGDVEHIYYHCHRALYLDRLKNGGKTSSQGHHIQLE